MIYLWEYSWGNWKQSFRSICTPRFIATLFTMAKSQKQPKRPSQMNGSTKCGAYIHTTKYYAALKSKKILTCTNKDEPPGHYTKWNKPITKRQTLYDFIYMRYSENSERQKVEHYFCSALWQGVRDRQPHIDVSLPLFLPTFPSKK